MILIKNGRVVDAKSNTDGILDVVLEGGKIKTIGKVEDDGSYEQVIDADGCVVAPGLIDVHVHFRDPGSDMPVSIRDLHTKRISRQVPPQRKKADTQRLSPWQIQNRR